MTSKANGRAQRATTVGLLLLLVAVLAAGWWSKARCIVDGDGWTDGEQYLAWCYTDIYPLWFSERLSEGATPYIDHPVEYPVLTGAQMLIADRVMRALPGPPSPTGFFHVTALMGAALLVWTFLLLRAEGLSRARLLRFVLAPTLLIYAFMNWDPLAIALCVAAIVAHRAGRDVEAGVLAGLGAAAKLFPVFLVPLVVAARLAQGRRRDALLHAGAAAGAWLVVNLPIMVVANKGWRRFLELNSERGPDWDSLWLFLQQRDILTLSIAHVNVLSALVFIVGAVVIVWLGARRRPPDRWWELLLPVLAWFLLANKVYSPQFSLWLLPLAALALPSTPAFVAFAAFDVMVFLVRFPYLGGVGGLQPAPGYGLFAAVLLFRAAALLWVIASAVRGRNADGLPDQPGAVALGDGEAVSVPPVG